MNQQTPTAEWLEWKMFVLLRELDGFRRKRIKQFAAAEFDRRMRKLGPQDVVVDLGANYGEFTEKMARTGATVHAFEPDPETFEELQNKLSQFPNVVLRQAAIGHETGEIRLFRGLDKDRWSKRRRSEASSIFVDGKDIDANNFVSVPMLDIKAVLEDIPGRISLLKMDIEGAEVPVLERLLDTSVLDKVDALFVETHEHIFPSLYRRTRALRRRVRLLERPYVNLDWH